MKEFGVYVVMIPLEKPKVGFMDSCSLSFIFFFSFLTSLFFPFSLSLFHLGSAVRTTPDLVFGFGSIICRGFVGNEFHASG